MNESKTGEGEGDLVAWAALSSYLSFFDTETFKNELPYWFFDTEMFKNELSYWFFDTEYWMDSPLN